MTEETGSVKGENITKGEGGINYLDCLALLISTGDIYIYIFTIMKPSFAVAYITVWHTPSLRLTVSSQLVPRVAAVQSACNTDVAVIVWSDVSVVLLKV